MDDENEKDNDELPNELIFFFSWVCEYNATVSIHIFKKISESHS